MVARYAIYYAPARESALWRRGCAWLGRDAESGACLDAPAIDGLRTARWRALTQAPRHYGFHATLKAPFALKDGTDPSDLYAAAEEFAGGQSAFGLPLKVAELDRFLALRPNGEHARIDRLAADVLDAFEKFRAPLDEAQRRRWEEKALSGRQRRNLERWGYPYVGGDFRFHMTLTGPLEPGERAAVLPMLQDYFADCLLDAPAIDGIAVFAQDDPEQAFRLRARFGFAD